MSLILDAAQFAAKCHEGQVRRVTGRPYIEHPIRVAGAVAIRPGSTKEMVAAAFLHDVMEDCGKTWGDIVRVAGFEVADMVEALTKPSKEVGNREKRNRVFMDTLKARPSEVQIIKLADRLDNLREMAGDKPEFIWLYCKESKELVREIGHAAEDLKKNILDEAQKLECTLNLLLGLKEGDLSDI